MGTWGLKAVVDAGPLIHLHEIGCFRFLNHFASLNIPDAVWLETVAQNRIPQTDILKINNIKRHSLQNSEVEKFIQNTNLPALHFGERECLYICVNKNISLLLTDDMAVRKAAKLLHIKPVGSLGVVILAFKREEITLFMSSQLQKKRPSP